MERYRIRTSIGEVILSLDPDGLELVSWPVYDNRGKKTGTVHTEFQNTKFKIESGEDKLTNLFVGSLNYIVKTDNGDLFAIIELDDGAYGSPEYLLEKI